MKNTEIKTRILATCTTLALLATGLGNLRVSALDEAAPVTNVEKAAYDGPLDEAAAAAFAATLNDEMKNVLNDYLDIDGVNSKYEEIAAKVTESGKFTGKTRQQIIQIYLQDTKAVVDNPDILNGMQRAFALLLNDADADDSAADSKPDRPATPPADKPTAPVSNTSLRQYIKGLRYDARKLLAVQGDGGTMIVDKEKDKKNERKLGNAKVIRCVRTSRSLSKNFEDVAILQPTQGVIYPGALIYADQELVDGKPRPLTGLPRSPITLRLDLPGLEDEGTFTIDNPTDGKVQGALNKALNFWNNSSSFKEGYVNPSRSNYSSTIAYSSDQLAMSLGFNAKWATGDASAQFKFSSNSEKNVVVAVYRQVFYTVTYDAPNLPEQFFAPSVTTDQAGEAFTTDNPSAPGYISSVNYGRIIMFRMETDKSTTAVDAQAAFNYAAGENDSVGGDLKAKYDKILNNSAITVVTMGGNAGVASESVAAKGSSDLQKIIKGKNALYSKSNPGVPIAYTVKFLKDNTIAKMGSTTDFVTEDCSELDNTWVKVIHNGGYIAHFYASWDEPDPNNLDGMIRRERTEEGKTAGFQAKFDFPGDATNVRIRMENDTGLIWQPRREIFNKVLLPVDYNRCYTVTGTSLDSRYESKTMGNDCP